MKQANHIKAAANREGSAAINLNSMHSISKKYFAIVHLNIVLVCFADPAKKMDRVWVTHVPLLCFEDVLLHLKDLQPWISDGLHDSWVSRR